MDIGHFEFDNQDTFIKGYMLGYPHELHYERLASAGQKSKSGKTLPTYEIKAVIGNRKMRVGCAWEETAKDGFSVYDSKFDNLGALFPDTLYARLVPSRQQKGVATLYWESPKEKAAYEAKRGAAATPAPAALAM